jgi:hypothetical protein
MPSLGTRVPANRNVRVPAQSPFNKQLTEKRKNGVLRHLLQQNNFQSFIMICRKQHWLAQFVVRHNLSNHQRDFVDTRYNVRERLILHTKF